MGEMSVLDPSAWEVSTLRLTAFPDPAIEFDHSSWWIDVAREPADTRVIEQKRERHRDEGPVEGGMLVLEVQRGRIDWLFHAPEPDPEMDRIPSMGDLPRVLETFCELMSRWFEVNECPTVTRLAFGAVLLYPVGDRETGYRQLAPYLPSVQLDPAGSSDFSYQINRSRDSISGIAGLRINRLSRWSVLRFGRISLLLRPAVTELRSVPVQDHFACRLELDINTYADYREALGREQLPRVFQELVALGREIVANGDIP